MNTNAISIFTFSIPRRMQQMNLRFLFACPYVLENVSHGSEKHESGRPAASPFSALQFVVQIREGITAVIKDCSCV